MEIYHREQEFSVLESLDGGDVNAFKSLSQAQGCENLAMPNTQMNIFSTSLESI